MNQFTLLPDAGKRLRRAVHLQYMGVVGCMALLVGLFTVMDTSPFDIGFGNISSYFSPGFVLLLVYAYELRKATRTASSFKLTISDDGLITREVSGTSPRSIPVHEVRFLRKWENETYVITGNDMIKPIVVPPGIERAEELEGLLTQLTHESIEVVNVKFHKVIPLGIGFAFAMVGSLLAENKYLGTVLGVLFIGGAVYCWVVIQRGKDYDRRLRLLSHLILLPVMAVAVRIIWHWAV